LVITGKVAVVLPPGTVTLDGTPATPVLLLDRLTTTRSLGAGAVSVTVPVEEPPPVTLDGSRLNAERDTLRVKKISTLPGVLSCQTTLMLPLESVAICGAEEAPESLERFSGVEKVAPPSLERVKKMAQLPRVYSCQTTLMLPLGSVAICAAKAPRWFERFCGVEKVAPPSLKRLKKMSPLSFQTTLMLSLESIAM
jgi:hypothetical protein